MTSLAAVLNHAETERDQALAALRRAEGQARPLQLQVEQLEGYRGEYEQRWTGQFSRQGTMEIVHCYSSFMQRLDEALADARQRANQAAQHCERLRARVLAAEMRVASVRKLIERREADAARVQQRREQRHSDEAALVLWRTAAPHH